MENVWGETTKEIVFDREFECVYDFLFYIWFGGLCIHVSIWVGVNQLNKRNRKIYTWVNKFFEYNHVINQKAVNTAQNTINFKARWCTCLCCTFSIDIRWSLEANLSLFPRLPSLVLSFIFEHPILSMSLRLQHRPCSCILKRRCTNYRHQIRNYSVKHENFIHCLSFVRESSW